MSTEKNVNPARIVVLINSIYIARHLLATADLSAKPDSVSLTYLDAAVKAMDELQFYLGIFDNLGAYCLQQELRKPAVSVMACSGLMNLITSDYGFTAIKYVLEDLPDSITPSKETVGLVIDRFLVFSSKAVQHLHQNPGHYEPNWYSPGGNPELARIPQARLLYSLQEGAVGRDVLIDVLSPHHDYLRHFLVIQEDKWRKKQEAQFGTLLDPRQPSQEDQAKKLQGGS